MTYNLINGQQKRRIGLSKTQCFKIMGVSSTGYYDWVKRYEEPNDLQSESKKYENDIKEKFREIIKKHGCVPGKRNFQMYLWRDHQINISVKKCKRIMNEMNLVAKRPKRDAYKGQATHFHKCMAAQNKVQQRFKVSPRQVILTDITYLYYGANRTVCYLCTFKDAYTNEILGSDVKSSMSVNLVVSAYNKMMDNYGEQIKTKQCFLHSDQGSQYLSTEFKRILKDDGFIQSMSDRGNSQDNAPMESFFGRLKTEIIDIIARCPSLEIVQKLVEGYINSYNTERYQYPLAGLTPSEYYQYSITGIYPLDNYFGVKADELKSIEELVESKMKIAREKAEKVKEANRKRREERSHIKAINTILSDRRILRKEIKKYTRSKEYANIQLNKLEGILDKSNKALGFLLKATKEILDKLKDPQNWKNYSELDYLKEIPDLY